MNVILMATERSALQDAIAAAERGNRGEIRVHIESRYPGDGPLGRAEALYQELGMAKTRDDTGVLLYVAERDHKAAVFAGTGVYGARKPELWKEIAAAVAQGYAFGDRVSGLVRALTMIGDILRETAPGDDLAGDELPNKVTTG